MSVTCGRTVVFCGYSAVSSNNTTIRHNITEILLKVVLGIINLTPRIRKVLKIPWIEEGQTTQCPKEKGQKDKQQSTKHYNKTKDRATQTPLKPGFVTKDRATRTPLKPGFVTKDRATRTPLKVFCVFVVYYKYLSHFLWLANITIDHWCMFDSCFHK